jgi:hypothetical protein
VAHQDNEANSTRIKFAFTVIGLSRDFDIRPLNLEFTVEPAV